MKTNYPGSYLYAFFYDGVNVAAQAVKTANSLDPKALKTALVGLKNYAGACGSLSTDAQQNFPHSMPVISAEGGKETFKTLVDDL